MGFSIIGKWKKNANDNVEIKENLKSGSIDIICSYTDGVSHFESIGTVVNPHPCGEYDVGDIFEVIWTDTDKSNGSMVGKLMRSYVTVVNPDKLQRDIGNDFCFNDTFFQPIKYRHDYCNPWNRVK